MKTKKKKNRVTQWFQECGLIFIQSSKHALTHCYKRSYLFPQAAQIIVCKALQGKLGKHVWKTKDLLIAADMNELSKITAVSWDYITRHVSRMQSILIKRQSQRSLLFFLKKIPKPGMPNFNSCRKQQSSVYRTKLRSNLYIYCGW